jgi:hypothetical protein
MVELHLEFGSSAMLTAMRSASLRVRSDAAHGAGKSRNSYTTIFVGVLN